MDKDLNNMIQKNLKEVKSEIKDLIAKYAKSRKTNILDIFQLYGKRYFSAPASTRYHECFEGGCATHSLKVVKRMLKLKDGLSPISVDDESILICGLFHDLGKIGDDKHDRYIKNTENWLIKKGIYYNQSENGNKFTHAQGSLFLLTKNNFPLTSDEFSAILSHDMLYVDENSFLKNNFQRLNDTLFLLHTADMRETMIVNEMMRK